MHEPSVRSRHGQNEAVIARVHEPALQIAGQKLREIALRIPALPFRPGHLQWGHHLIANPRAFHLVGSKAVITPVDPCGMRFTLPALSGCITTMLVASHLTT